MATPPDFTSGAVLTAAQMNSVGLWLVKTQTIGTAVSSVTVTGAFSADYDNYKIIISGGASSAQAFLNLQLGASTTGYYYANSGVTYAGVAFVGGASNTTSFLGGSAFIGNGLQANIELQNPFLAKYTFSQCSGLNTTLATPSIGYHGVATSYTAFTILASTGTLTGGTIRVYGYRN
jgi:hypothetical protein